MAIPLEEEGNRAVVIKPTNMPKEKQLEAIKSTASCVNQCILDGTLDYERLCRVCVYVCVVQTLINSIQNMVREDRQSTIVVILNTGHQTVYRSIVWFRLERCMWHFFRL